MNILDEIVEQRKKDIEKKSVTLGFSIPEKRTRPVSPTKVRIFVVADDSWFTFLKYSFV